MPSWFKANGFGEQSRMRAGTGKEGETPAHIVNRHTEMEWDDRHETINFSITKKDFNNGKN